MNRLESCRPSPCPHFGLLLLLLLRLLRLLAASWLALRRLRVRRGNRRRHPNHHQTPSARLERRRPDWSPVQCMQFNAIQCNAMQCHAVHAQRTGHPSPIRLSMQGKPPVNKQTDRTTDTQTDRQAGRQAGGWVAHPCSSRGQCFKGFFFCRSCCLSLRLGCALGCFLAACFLGFGFLDLEKLEISLRSEGQPAMQAISELRNFKARPRACTLFSPR